MKPITQTKTLNDKEIEKEFGTNSFNIINKELTNKTKSGKQISVDGMCVFKEVVNEKAEKELMDFFESEFTKRGILKGDKPRTMYYGIKDLDCTDIIPPFPDILKPLIYQFVYKEIFDKISLPECLEVKEYTNKQGVNLKQPEEYIFFATIILGDPWCCFVNTPDYGGTNLAIKLLPRICITFNKDNCNYIIPKTRRQDIRADTMVRSPNFKMYTLTFKKLNEII